mgnify:FL=1
MLLQALRGNPPCPDYGASRRQRLRESVGDSTLLPSGHAAVDNLTTDMPT